MARNWGELHNRAYSTRSQQKSVVCLNCRGRGPVYDRRFRMDGGSDQRWLPLLLLRLLGNVHHACVHFNGRLDSGCKIILGAINEWRLSVKERYGLWIGSDLHSRHKCPLLRSMSMQCWPRNFLYRGCWVYVNWQHGCNKTRVVPLWCKRTQQYAED